MSPRPTKPAHRPVLISLCLFAVAFALAIVCAATAHAANYRMLLCAGNNGSNSFDTATNTVSGANPGGIFNFENYCGPAPDPAGNNAFLRISENQSGGMAGDTAYGSISWTVPPWVAILAGGGYTREPGSFNAGWRGRFWAEDFGGGGHHILLQGTGVENGSNGGIGWGTTSTFASHLWPFPTYGYYRRFIFELTCMRPAGCDRSGWNGVDANTIHLTLADVSPVELHLTNTSAPLLGGQWVRGTQVATYSWSEVGSGIRMEWIDIDGARRFTLDHASECDIGWSATSGEFARQFSPCAQASGIGRSYTFDSASLPDGAHTLQACAQDYAQYQGLDGTGGASCDTRTIRTDNTPPGKPAALAIRSANPNRYLDHFGATFSLPPDPGSPIAHVHYLILNAKNEVVVPQQVVGGNNPTEVADIQGPRTPGAYHLKLWLEDSVGFQGPAAEVAIPHDTTPPAAPQELQVGGSGTRWLSKADVHWTNVVDNGSPIDMAHYQLLGPAGEVLDGTHAVKGANVEKIEGLQTPEQRGHYKLRVWLTDEEGNVGAPSTVPLPIDTTPPAAPQELHVVGQTSRWASRLDLAWKDLTDDGSPIDAAHYRFLDAAGNPVGATQTVSGQDPQALHNLQTPAQRAHYKLQLWLEDAEGNVGAASAVALPIDTTPPAAPQGLTVAAPDSPRSKDGFDLQWRDIADDGSPITAAHYEVLGGGDKVAVPAQTVKGNGVDRIADIQSPDPAGTYTLKLWLEDEEGNAGAPATVPLSYECARSAVGGGASLGASISDGTVAQGQSDTLSGALRQSSRAPVAGAPLCIFEQVEGDGQRHYLGLAYTDTAGNYRFTIPPGPSRTLRAVYRTGNRRLVAEADMHTRVKPSLRARRSVLHNGQFAHLEGQLPGPRNDDVVVVLQVRLGKGWLAFRRYRTRGGGHFAANYHFRRTTRPTIYAMRAQVRETGGYPYVQGNSDQIHIKVLPKGRRASCSMRERKHRRPSRCLASAHRRCVKARRAAHRNPSASALRSRAHRLCSRVRRHGRHSHRRAG